MQEKRGKFELLYIVNPQLTEDEIAALHDKVKAAITENEGVIEKENHWGRRRLAYEVQKFREGYYIYAEFEGIGKTVKSIDALARIETGIIRHLVTRIPKAKALEEVRKAEAEARRAAREALRLEKEAAREAEAAAKAAEAAAELAEKEAEAPPSEAAAESAPPAPAEEAAPEPVVATEASPPEPEPAVATEVPAQQPESVPEEPTPKPVAEGEGA